MAEIILYTCLGGLIIVSILMILKIREMNKVIKNREECMKMEDEKNSLDIHEYYSEKIKKIKEIISSNTYPPVFKEEKWKNCNCYAYALNLNVGDPKRWIWIPGCISDENADKQLWDDVTSKVKKDLDFLGISYRDNEGKLKEGEWRIAIYCMATPHDWPISFHISRQDADGVWSEKTNWINSPVKKGEKTDCPPDLSRYDFQLENVLILSKK